MNGFIKKVTAAGFMATGAISVIGCSCTYDDLVDPCWPQRYTAIAREEVREPMALQADNGLFLDQTIWNHHFVEGTGQLTEGGQAVLTRLARRRPAPVPDIFVQTAHDVRYDAQRKPEDFGKDRLALDNKRTQAVNHYLAAIRPDVRFNIGVHDPAPVGMSGVEAAKRVQEMIGAAPRGTVQTEAEQANRNVSEQKIEEKKDVNTREDIEFEKKPEARE